MGLHNFESTMVPVNTKWDLNKFELLLQYYHDNSIVDFMRYGWPISHDGRAGNNKVPNNWPGVQNNREAVASYFQRELSDGSVLGPFNGNPFCSNALLSPLNTRDKKDSTEKRIIVDMSFPPGNSVNDGIKKDFYMENEISLRYPTVDRLVDIVRKKGKGCMLFKCDLPRFYRQIPVCPKDYNKLGVVLKTLGFLIKFWSWAADPAAI